MHFGCPKDLISGVAISTALFTTIVHSPAFGQSLGEGYPQCAFPNRVSSARSDGTTAAKDVRPTSIGSLRSAQLPIVIHWQEGVEPDYVTEILGHTEAAWNEEFFRLGFLPPRSDGVVDTDPAFDVYIVTTLDPGVGGYAGFSGFDETTVQADAFGYLVINNALPPRFRRFVVAHELFHTSQMAYDWWEDLAFMEGSATWITRRAFADDDIWWRYVPFFNAEPWKAVDYVSIMAPYQYGTALFSMYLDERFGGSDGKFVRSMWERSVQTDLENEPDFLDAATQLLGDDDAFDDAYAEFGVWRLLTGPRKSWSLFQDGTKWSDNVAPTIEVTLEPSIQAASGAMSHPLQPYSHAYISLRRSPGETRSASFQLAGDPATRFDVRIVRLGDGPAITQRVGTLTGGAPLTFTLPHDQSAAEQVIVITNITDGHYDADTSSWTGRSLQWSFELSPEG